MKTGSEQADPQRHTNWIPVHAEEQMGFDDTLKSTGRGPCHCHFYTTLPFTAAPVPTCAGACPAPHQVCQCEGRACPPIPRPHPGPGAEQRLRQGSTVDLALASKGARGRLPSPREACGLALVWGREVTVTVGLLEPLLCAVICEPLLHRPVCSSLSETHHG